MRAEGVWLWDASGRRYPDCYNNVPHRHEAARLLHAARHALDYGLIHADLVRENVLADPPCQRLLDFDDGRFGFRLFDITTVLLNDMEEPRYDTLKAALITGYRSRRPIDEQLVQLFLSLRAATYVGWIVPRIAEQGGPSQRFACRQSASALC